MAWGRGYSAKIFRATNSRARRITSDKSLAMHICSLVPRPPRPAFVACSTKSGGRLVSFPDPPRNTVAEKGNVSRFAFRVSHSAFRIPRFAFRVWRFAFRASISMGGTYVGWVSCSQVCTIDKSYTIDNRDVKSLLSMLIRARAPGAGDRNGLNSVM